jgi:hypothetical protein
VANVTTKIENNPFRYFNSSPVLRLMKLRRPGVRIETAEGEPLSFFN